MEIFKGGSKMNGFLKFLSSSKYQLVLIITAVIVWAIATNRVYALDGIHTLRDLAIAYCSARILEPIVEYILSRRN